MYIFCAFQELELGLEDQAIIKEGDKLYLVLNTIFNEAKRSNLGKLRMLIYTVHVYVGISCTHVCTYVVCKYMYGTSHKKLTYLTLLFPECKSHYICMLSYRSHTITVVWFLVMNVNTTTLFLIQNVNTFLTEMYDSKVHYKKILNPTY